MEEELKIFNLFPGSVDGCPGLLIAPMPDADTCDEVDDGLADVGIAGNTYYGEVTMQLGLMRVEGGGDPLAKAVGRIRAVFKACPGATLVLAPELIAANQNLPS
jgi:hypothetical protein